MKHFNTVIFVLLFLFTLQGDARKVCILYEQKSVPVPTILSEESIVVKREISDLNEDIPVLTEEIPPEINDAVTEEAVTEETVTEETVTEALKEEVLTEEAKTEGISEVTEAVAKLANISVIPRSNNDNLKSNNICALEGITLFDDQNHLLRRMCTITSASKSLYVVTVQDSVVKSDLLLSTLCAEGAKGLLSWIAWHDFMEKIQPLLNAVELPQLVVRNSSIGVPNESDSFSEVLIEMLPIRYRLLNMKPSAWNNNTFIKTVSLGNIELENSDDTERHIEGDLSYSYPIETNITFLSSYPINGLLVEMSDESDESKNFIVGSTNTYVYNNTFNVERLVPAFKKEIVSLKGTFGLHEHDIEGTIVSIFGVNTDGTTIEESLTISARVVSSKTFDIKDTHYLEDYTTTTTEKPETTPIEELPIAIPRTTGPVYPGFKNVFYVAVVLFFGTLIIAAFDVTRKLRRDRKEKSKGRRTYEKVIPKL